MSDASYDNPTDTISAKILHLAHLVSATTDLLSACFSFTMLIRQCVDHTTTSDILIARAEMYHTSLQFCRKSLTVSIDYVHIQLSMTPLFPKFEGLESRQQKLTEAAFLALRKAARECTKITPLLERIDDYQTNLDDYDRAVLWRGWPTCPAQEELEVVKDKLLSYRGDNDRYNPGWLKGVSTMVKSSEIARS